MSKFDFSPFLCYIITIKSSQCILRAKKKKDYLVWKEAALLWAGKTRGRTRIRYDRAINKDMHIQLLSLKDKLEDTRKYK